MAPSRLIGTVALSSLAILAFATVVHAEVILPTAAILVTAVPPEKSAESEKMQETIRKYHFNEGEKQRLEEIRNVQDKIKREKALPDTAKHQRAMRKAKRRSRNLKRANPLPPGSLWAPPQTRTRGERRKNLHKLNSRLRELEEMKGKYPTRLYLRDLSAGTAGVLHCTIPERRTLGRMIVPAHTSGVAMRIVQVVDSENLVVLVSGGEYEDKIWFSGFSTEKLSDGDKFPPPGSPVAITGERRDHLGDLLIVATPFEPSQEPASKSSADLPSNPQSPRP